MDLKRLQTQLIEDEGLRLVVYKDSRGLPTVGIGHLVVPADMLLPGQRISRERAEKLFLLDVTRTLADCERELDGWSSFPGEVQEILANMAFNLGITGLLKFKNTLALIRHREYAQAADALVKSLWHSQVGDRARRLEARLRALQP